MEAISLGDETLSAVVRTFTLTTVLREGAAAGTGSIGSSWGGAVRPMKKPFRFPSLSPEGLLMLGGGSKSRPASAQHANRAESRATPKQEWRRVIPLPEMKA